MAPDKSRVAMRVFLDFGFYVYGLLSSAKLGLISLMYFLLTAFVNFWGEWPYGFVMVMGGLLAELDLIMGEDYDLLGEVGFGFASWFVDFASNCCSFELCCFILAEFGSCKWFMMVVALLSNDFFELFKKEKRVGLPRALMFWVPVLPASRVVLEVLSSPIFNLFGDP